jgi:hypothetical protein
VANRRLELDFPFASNAPLQKDLKRLVQVLEIRFEALEAIAGSFEDSANQFEQLGLSRLNDLLTPLASQAVARLGDITQLFGATSTTSVELELVEKQFLIPVDQRNTYVPTPYIAIYAVGETDVGMIARRVGFAREEGILTVMPVVIIGTGTYSSWQLSVSPAPSMGGYTRAEVDVAIADLNAAREIVSATKADIASPVFTGSPKAPNPGLDSDEDDIATTSWSRAVAITIATALVDAAIDAVVIPAPVIDDIATNAQFWGATLGKHGITTPLLASVAAPVALTDAATISLDWKSGINFTVTLGGNRTLGNPSNGIPGSWRTIQVSQDVGGTKTLAYGTQYVFPGGGTTGKPVIAPAANAVSRISIYCRTTTVFEVYQLGMGLAA